MFDKNLYKDKLVFVAGGTSGINLGIAKGFSAHGAKLVVIGRDEAKAQRAAAEISAASGNVAQGYSADVREPDALQALYQQVVKDMGSIDVLVSGAAGNFIAPAVSLSPKGFKTVIDIDLLGTYNVFHCAFPYLTKPGASLIAITAPQAVNPMPYQIHACAAKAGINMVVKCLAMEWGPAGVRVNGISPGPIAETEGMARLAPTEKLQQAYKKAVSLRRWGLKEEIASAALFLSSAGAAYINGTILDVDGGMQLGDASADCLTPTR